MVAITEEGGGGLRGRRALVTGSTGGIGWAVAERLAAAGCELVLHGLASEDEGAARVAALAGRGVRARYVRADLGVVGEVERLAGESGAVDVLVNNAATRHFGPVEAMQPAEWDEDIAVNLSAAFHLIRLLLPGMRRRGFGRIVNMSSIYGLVGTAGRVGYVTTKTALIGLTRAVALETVRSGVTCNAVCPGSTLTPDIEARLARAMAATGADHAEAAARFLEGKQPSGRFVAAEAIASAVALLCGPAGADITGIALPVDGGWSAA